MRTYTKRLNRIAGSKLVKSMGDRSRSPMNMRPPNEMPPLVTGARRNSTAEGSATDGSRPTGPQPPTAAATPNNGMWLPGGDRGRTAHTPAGPRSAREETVRSRLSVLTRPELEALVVALQTALEVMSGQHEAAARI